MNRDYPLTLQWLPLSDTAFDDLGLRKPRSRDARLAQKLILAEACISGASDPDGWISYSRSRDHYSARRGRYFRREYTYANIVPNVDDLASEGLLEHEKAAPGTLAAPGCFKRQSRFRASPRLMQRYEQRPEQMMHVRRELIVLRDADKNQIDYNETAKTRQMRKGVQEINEALGATSISFHEKPINEGHALLIGNMRIGAASKNLHRIFNRRSFAEGGRFYGGIWENLAKKFRQDIEIDGNSTEELDYPSLHPTLLYAEAGKVLEGDPYDLVGWPRELVKMAFNTLVNANTRTAAIQSIAQRIGGEGAFANAEKLASEIEARHPDIAHMFGTGAGLRLQHTDSDMAEMVMKLERKQGVVVLSVHDSFIVSNVGDNVSNLAESMDAAWSKFTDNNQMISMASLINVLQYGDTGDTGDTGRDTGGSDSGVVFDTRGEMLTFLKQTASQDKPLKIFVAPDVLANPNQPVQIVWNDRTLTVDTGPA